MFILFALIFMRMTGGRDVQSGVGKNKSSQILQGRFDLYPDPYDVYGGGGGIVPHAVYDAGVWSHADARADGGVYPWISMELFS